MAVCGRVLSMAWSWLWLFVRFECVWLARVCCRKKLSKEGIAKYEGVKKTLATAGRPELR